MKFIKNEIESVDLSLFFSEIAETQPYVYEEHNHYKLLSYLTMQYNNILMLDVGTRQGHSALSLAQNPNNKIITYDIDNHWEDHGYPNIEFKLLDINKETAENLLKADIIFLDIDPHEGQQETVFYDTLCRINYKGIVICDDIHLTNGMDNFWNRITTEKYDLTEFGHWSGTGLINFSDEKIEIE